MVGGAPVSRLRYSDVWAFSEQFADAAITRTDGAIDVFQVASEARVIHRFPSTDSRTSRTCCLFISEKKGRSPPFVAYGTTDGQVFMQGRFVTRLEGPPSNLCANQDALYACDIHAKTVVVIDSTSGNVANRYKVAAHHIGKLSFLAVSSKRPTFAVCSQSISIHSANDGELIKSLVGHPSPISAATFVRNDSLLLTGSRDDHHLFLWDVSDDPGVNNTGMETRSSGKKKRRRSTSSNTAVHTFVAPEPGARSIVVSEAQNGGVFVAGLMKSGLIAIWNWDTGTDGGSSKPICLVHPCVENAKDGAPAVHGIGFQNRNALTVLYGNNLKPKVHSVAVASAEEKVYLPSPGIQNLFVNQSFALRDGQVADIDGCTQAATRAETEAPNAVASVPKTIANGKLGSAANTSHMRDEEATGIVEANGATSEQEDASESEREENEDDRMLTERLASLGVSSESSRSVTSKRLVEIPKETGNRTTYSKAQLIQQALASKDDKLLNSIVLKKQDNETISSSVRVIGAELATGALLNELAQKLRTIPRCATELMAWIREIIFEYSNVLAHMQTNPAIEEIREIAQARLNNLPALMRLQGRLELMDRYASRAKKTRQNTFANRPPQLQYLELVQDAKYTSSKDESSSEDEAEENSSSDDSSGGE